MKPSGIRKFFDIVSEMEDVVSLGVGEPDFDTPWAIRDEGIYSLEKGRTFYTSNAGLKQLREQIALYLHRRFSLNYDPMKEIFVTVGGSEGIDMAFRAMLNPGDEVLVPQPCYVSYVPCVELAGGRVVPIPLKAENQFRLTAQELLDAVTEKTKILVLPFPNNPTGAVMEREDLEKIAEVILEKDLYVLSDEIYAELTYTGNRHVSIAELPGMAERTIVINGFSKAYAMTGWRLGYACGPKEIIAQMIKIHQYCIMCAPSTSQLAVVEAAMNADNEIKKMRDEYNHRRRVIVQGLKDAGLDCFTPYGAFYAFPSIKSTGLSSEEFCERFLLEKHVAIVPGNAFGACGEGFVRISYAASLEDIKEAMKLLKEFVEELKKG